MDQQAVQEAARHAIAHSGGPDAQTDPQQALDALAAALESGATPDDIAAEMLRQRGK